MRLAVCALSAVLLSGCSWLGGSGGFGGNFGGAQYAQSSQYGGQYAQRGAGQQNPCVVPSPRSPLPRGCSPASVTIGGASGGFPQQPNFGGSNYASAGYGSHADVAGQQSANYKPRKSLRKPKLRGSLSLGFEKSISGDIQPSIDGLNGIYNPQVFNQIVTSGSEAGGNITTSRFTANAENLRLDNDTSTFTDDIFTPDRVNRIDSSSVSFENAHSTPIRLGGGLEYIINPKTTVFANAGYSYSEGEGVDVFSANASIYRLDSSQDFVTNAAAPSGFSTTGIAVETLTELEPQEIAAVNFQFNDLNRVDLEVGGRRYFNPLVKNQGFKTLTPFIGASVGATYFNTVSADVTSAQTNFEDAFNGDGAPRVSAAAPARVVIADSQWVPSGQLNAGVEWQVTPKTAFAFESGLKFEGSRNGQDTDTNIAIPFTVRGSYNF